MTTSVERLRSQIVTILDPAKTTYAEIGEQIEAKLAELAELRAEQAEVRRLIRAFEPEFDKRDYSDRNGKKRSSRNSGEKYSANKRAEVLEWLRLHAEELNQGDGFYATRASQLPGSPVNQSGLSAILASFHEQGYVRLTKSSGKGARKYFKVVV